MVYHILQCLLNFINYHGKTCLSICQSCTQHGCQLYNESEEYQTWYEEHKYNVVPTTESHLS